MSDSRPSRARWHLAIFAVWAIACLSLHTISLGGADAQAAPPLSSEANTTATKEAAKLDRSAPTASKSSDSANLGAARFRAYLENGGDLRRLFRPLVEGARDSVVRIQGRWTIVALGTIVDPNGWILTKASSLPDEPKCILPDGSTHIGKVVGIDHEYDLALLRIPGQHRLDVTFDTEKSYGLGQWMASIGLGTYPIAIGTTSVPPRPIPSRRRGFLGVGLSQSRNGVRVDYVEEESAAAASSIRKDDQFTSVNGRKIRSTFEAIAAIQSNAPGSVIELEVLRGGEAIPVRVKLGGREKEGAEDYGEGDLSPHRSGFPSALQHDGAVEPEYMGGPVIDSSGHVVAINVARAGRTQTLAVPIAKALEVFRRLRNDAGDV